MCVCVCMSVCTSAFLPHGQFDASHFGSSVLWKEWVTIAPRLIYFICTFPIWPGVTAAIHHTIHLRCGWRVRERERERHCSNSNSVFCVWCSCSTWRPVYICAHTAQVILFFRDAYVVSEPICWMDLKYDFTRVTEIYSCPFVLLLCWCSLCQMWMHVWGAFSEKAYEIVIDFEPVTWFITWQVNWGRKRHLIACNCFLRRDTGKSEKRERERERESERERV